MPMRCRRSAMPHRRHQPNSRCASRRLQPAALHCATRHSKSCRCASRRCRCAKRLPIRQPPPGAPLRCPQFPVLAPLLLPPSPALVRLRAAAGPLLAARIRPAGRRCPQAMALLRPAAKAATAQFPLLLALRRWPPQKRLGRKPLRLLPSPTAVAAAAGSMLAVGPLPSGSLPLRLPSAKAATTLRLLLLLAPLRRWRPQKRLAPCHLRSLPARLAPCQMPSLTAFAEAAARGMPRSGETYFAPNRAGTEAAGARPPEGCVLAAAAAAFGVRAAAIGLRRAAGIPWGWKACAPAPGALSRAPPRGWGLGSPLPCTAAPPVAPWAAPAWAAAPPSAWSLARAASASPPRAAAPAPPSSPPSSPAPPRARPPPLPVPRGRRPVSLRALAAGRRPVPLLAFAASAAPPGAAAPAPPSSPAPPRARPPPLPVPRGRRPVPLLALAASAAALGASTPPSASARPARRPAPLLAGAASAARLGAAAPAAPSSAWSSARPRPRGPSLARSWRLQKRLAPCRTPCRTPGRACAARPSSYRDSGDQWAEAAAAPKPQGGQGPSPMPMRRSGCPRAGHGQAAPPRARGPPTPPIP